MINFKVIGLGGAGNKATIDLIENGFDPSNVMLLNSTGRDIPEEYKNYATIYGINSSYGGSGKERTVGRRVIATAMQTEGLSKKIDDFCSDETTDIIVLVSSAEGGTGSGTLPIVASYIRQVIGKPVIAFIFFGFGADGKGLSNSVQICKELSDDIGVVGIHNAKFMEEDTDSQVKAEKKANEYFIDALTVLTGKTIFESYQNIDKTDLMKIVTTPGYINIGTMPLKGIKNRSQYNEAINLAVDSEKYIESTTKKVHRMAVIFTMRNPESGIVDFKSEVLRERLGVPYEYYTHIQTIEGSEEYVSWIAVGQDLPTDGIKEIYDEWIKSSEEFTTQKNSVIDKDSFFKSFAENDGEEVYDVFGVNNGSSDKKPSKKDFFGGFDY